MQVFPHAMWVQSPLPMLSITLKDYVFFIQETLLKNTPIFLGRPTSSCISVCIAFKKSVRAAGILLMYQKLWSIFFLFGATTAWVEITTTLQSVSPTPSKLSMLQFSKNCKFLPFHWSMHAIVLCIKSWQYWLKYHQKSVRIWLRHYRISSHHWIRNDGGLVATVAKKCYKSYFTA